MYNPVSTYRLQFNKDFTFEEARLYTEYFHLLGTGTIYASPVFAATPGSMHGYDITNPHAVNPGIGTGEELKKLAKSLKNQRIGWLQDIVPNHMAFNHHNKWLMDVLEKGRDSEYADFFDIDRQDPQFRGKLMVPFLGDEAQKVLERGEINLTWSEGAFRLSYFDNLWPVRAESFLWLMEQTDNSLPTRLSLLIDQYRPDEKTPDYLFLNGEWERFKTDLADLCNTNKEVLAFFENLAADVSNDPDAILALFNNQHYILAYWKETEQRINYRRFFTVNDLICLRMEDEKTFNLYHREIRHWIHHQVFDGLRVDHVDGLGKPNEYLARLRKLAGNKPYIAVEKILEAGESLPVEWPIQGTSGYDFLGQVNNLLTYKKGMAHLQTLYSRVTGNGSSVDDVIYQSKKIILNDRMHGEWKLLTTLFHQSRLLEGETAQQFSKEQIKTTIGELLLAMPVYRLYPDHLPLQGNDRAVIQKVFADSIQRNPGIAPVIPAFEELLLARERVKGDRDERILKFFTRMMQFSGPLMAKGVEDTTMYRYNCFIGHNEVGDAPGAEGITISGFHEAMQQRQKEWPLTMNTTSTHDTKRGEDVRTRLNIITELPAEWEEKVLQWMEMNRHFKTKVGDKEAPSPNEEYFIYQTLTGAAPLDGDIDKTFLERITRYMEKASREAKENTSWSNPNPAWEKAVTNFIQKIFNPGHGFKSSFFTFQQKTAWYGIFNSLSQLTLKCTCPGIPDIYRGTESWDFTLVDPDNRQPVDFQERTATLKHLREQYSLAPAKLFQNLISNPENGNIKLWLTHRLLRYRKENPALFARGEYIPLQIKGLLKKHVTAFARQHKNAWHVTIIPLFISWFEDHGHRVSPREVDWKNTRVILPPEAPHDWINVFTGRPYSSGQEIHVSEVFEISPVGVLHANSGRKGRAAGVLMHITSLPGRFASGDFGTNARRFVDFLKESGHSYWQVLPFTRTTPEEGWSPYSPPSAFAGNTILISPQKLLEESLISKKQLKEQECGISEKADFRKALSIRENLTKVAWENFMSLCSAPARQKFFEFNEQEKYWLDDYALFAIFKKEFNRQPWNLWPAEIKDRNPEILAKYKKEHEKEIELEKFRQYLFSRQWHELKRHANHHGIRVIGDVPIYVSYDNADVWAHPHLFKLDADKKMTAVAGVPPDYFSETGQLWGMPVYDWKNMEKEDFQWWVQRVRKNLELYDLVRLDHFRGFEAYWEVPFGEETAENGIWLQGPGKKLFNHLKKEFPEMPFIAEDLGEVDDNVYQLRDEFGLPGMKVLQFAFGDDLAESVHAPHNHTFNSVVYSGTHDNNTVRGWYQQELDKASKKRINLYTGNKVKSKNIHRVVTRLAWASRAKLVVIPVQDITGKGVEAQMNRPSVALGNWTWRIKSMDELQAIAGETRELLGLFAR